MPFPTHTFYMCVKVKLGNITDNIPEYKQHLTVVLSVSAQSSQYLVFWPTMISSICHMILVPWEPFWQEMICYHSYQNTTLLHYSNTGCTRLCDTSLES